MGFLNLGSYLWSLVPSVGLHPPAKLLGALKKRRAYLRRHRVQLRHEYIFERALALNLPIWYPHDLHFVSDRDRDDARKHCFHYDEVPQN